MSFPVGKVPTFLAVLGTCSFSVEARQRGREPCAIGMAIVYLKAERGLPLFDRNNKELMPKVAELDR